MFNETCWDAGMTNGVGTAGVDLLPPKRFKSLPIKPNAPEDKIPPPIALEMPPEAAEPSRDSQFEPPPDPVILVCKGPNFSA
jgi:hypothetical protein